MSEGSAGRVQGGRESQGWVPWLHSRPGSTPELPPGLGGRLHPQLPSLLVALTLRERSSSTAGTPGGQHGPGVAGWPCALHPLPVTYPAMPATVCPALLPVSRIPEEAGVAFPVCESSTCSHLRSSTRSCLENSKEERPGGHLSQKADQKGQGGGQDVSPNFCKTQRGQRGGGLRFSGSRGGCAGAGAGGAEGGHGKVVPCAGDA